MKTQPVRPYYFCKHCGFIHDATLLKMQKHMTELRAQGLLVYLKKQGRSVVLEAVRK